MSNFTTEVKQKLRDVGQRDLECKNEYRVPIGKRYSSVDYVWLKKVPCPKSEKTPSGEKKVVAVAFEITKDISTLWNTKKMKGDIVNLQLTNASLGVLVIPCREKLKEQANALGGGAERWLEGINDYIEALLSIARPMKVEVWCYDQEKEEFHYF